MMRTKKGIGQIMKLIISLPIFLLIGLFFTVGLFQLGEEFVIDNVHNITVEAGQTIGINNSWINLLNTLHTDFGNVSPPFELLFAMLLVIAFGSSLYVAVVSKPLPSITFFGSLILGLALMLLLTTFVDQFASWWLNDFFYRVFDSVSNGLLDWYFANLGLANAVWMGVVLFLNQIDIDLGRMFSRRTREGGIVEE